MRTEKELLYIRQTIELEQLKRIIIGRVISREEWNSRMSMEIGKASLLLDLTPEEIEKLKKVYTIK